MQSTQSISPGFRPDINGLRAWSVVAVVLYHFKVAGFSGGFVGVDIFFVISGLLMTGIIVDGLERGSFSVLKFYMARACRIIPALLVLCTVLLTLGWLWLPATDYKILASHATTSLTFISNIKYWLEAGYFDSNSHDKWLLHTWSLSVEWQFYVLLPLILLGTWKIRSGRKLIFWVLLIGMLLSLGLCIALTPSKPTGTFFVLPTRAWEMIAGGLTYLSMSRFRFDTGIKRLLEIIGLVSTVWAIFTFDSMTPWPGWRAMFPVVSAVLILLAARTDSIWTNNPIAQWIGTRSYSLYLWHWPIVVALVYLDSMEKPWLVTSGLGLTLLLGHFSFQWVESYSRSALNKLSLRQGAFTLAGVTIFITMAGLGIQWKQGVMGRLSPNIDLVSQEALNKNPKRDYCQIEAGTTSPSCMYGGKVLQAIVLGDSHADALVSAVASAIKKPEGGVMEWSYSSCTTTFGLQPVPGRKGSNYHCDLFLNWVSKELGNIPKNIPLIIINRTSAAVFGPNEDGGNIPKNSPSVYFTNLYKKPEPAFLEEFSEKLISTTCTLAKDRTVYLVRPIPEMGVKVPNLARSMVLGMHKDISISLEEYHKRHAFIWGAQDAAHFKCGVKILDPLPYLCWDGKCHGSKDGRPMYYDDNHLSEFGNRLLIPMFSTISELNLN